MSLQANEWAAITPEGLYPNSANETLDKYGKLDKRQVEACRKWLRIFADKSKSMNRRYSSYSFKHHVEHWTERYEEYGQIDLAGRKWGNKRLYIANGAFIEAARLEGFRIGRCDKGSCNAYFNIKLKHEALKQTKR